MTEISDVVDDLDRRLDETGIKFDVKRNGLVYGLSKVIFYALEKIWSFNGHETSGQETLEKVTKRALDVNDRKRVY